MFGTEEAELWPRSWLCDDHHQYWHNVMRVAPDLDHPRTGNDGRTVRRPLRHEDRCRSVKRKEHGIKRVRVSTWRCQLQDGHDGPHHVPGQAPW